MRADLTSERPDPWCRSASRKFAGDGAMIVVHIWTYDKYVVRLRAAPELHGSRPPSSSIGAVPEQPLVLG